MRSGLQTIELQRVNAAKKEAAFAASGVSVDSSGVAMI